MVALRQLALPEVAAHHRVAVLVNAISEVLAGHADHAAFPVLQVAIVDKIPLPLDLQQYSCTAAGQGGLATGSAQRMVKPCSLFAAT